MSEQAFGMSYAADRWAVVVMAGARAATDPSTLSKWAVCVGKSISSLATCCRAAKLSPRRSLELARLLRALAMTGGTTHELMNVLDVAEPRTLMRLIGRAGLTAALDSKLPRSRSCVASAWSPTPSRSTH